MERRKKGNQDKGKFGKMKISKETWKMEILKRYKFGKMESCKNGSLEKWK